MPIRVKLDAVLLQRGMSLTELSQMVGITLPNLSVLKSNRARAIRFRTLAAVCGALACQPGDLLEYVSGAPVPSPPPAASEPDTATPR
jgi:putative transcriptional regulator